MTEPAIDSASVTGNTAAAGRTTPWTPRAIGLVAVLTAAHAATFVNKPPHVDDALFLMTARGILEDPARPLCQTVNWHQTAQPIREFAANPPLYNYQQAAIVRVCGWNLTALHLLSAAYIFLAGAAFLALAQRFTHHPLTALLLFMTCPTWLPQTNMMLDVPAMALITTAAALWVAGIDRGSTVRLAAGAVACGLAILTKYNSVVILPALVLYAWLSGRRASIGWLAIPAAMLALWCAHNRWIFPDGSIHLLSAGQGFQRHSRSLFQMLRLPLMTLGASFCFLPAWCVWRWSRDRFATVFVIGLPLGLLLAVDAVLRIGSAQPADSLLAEAAGIITRTLLPGRGGAPARVAVSPLWPEAILFSVNGAAMLLFVAAALLNPRKVESAAHDPLAPGATTDAADADRRRRCDSLFLGAWLFAIIAFNGLFAPHHAPRYYMPGFPAMALLLLRAMESLGGRSRVAVPASILVQAVLACVLAGADGHFARASVEMAREIAADKRFEGRPVGFLGHWGFQWQAEQAAGWYAVDVLKPPPPIGDWIVMAPDSDGTELPPWLRREEYRRPDGSVERVRFKLIETRDRPHPWPLETIDEARMLLLYGTGLGHGQPPWARSDGRTCKVLMLQRVS